MKLTVQLAKATVKASYPNSCCRFGWVTVNGTRDERYEIFPTLATSGRFVGKSYRSPTILGRAVSAGEAWKAAARKLIAAVGSEER